MSTVWGSEHGAALKPEGPPTVEPLIDTWTQSSVQCELFPFARLTDADLARVVEFTNPRGDKRSLTLLL